MTTLPKLTGGTDRQRTYADTMRPQVIRNAHMTARAELDQLRDGRLMKMRQSMEVACMKFLEDIHNTRRANWFLDHKQVNFHPILCRYYCVEQYEGVEHSILTETKETIETIMKDVKGPDHRYFYSRDRLEAWAKRVCEEYEQVLWDTACEMHVYVCKQHLLGNIDKEYAERIRTEMKHTLQSIADDWSTRGPTEWTEYADVKPHDRYKQVGKLYRDILNERLV